MKQKFCKDCESAKSRGEVLPDGRGVSIAVCLKYGDPVTAEPLPCKIARTQEFFCGIEGRGYSKKKEEDPPPKNSLVLVE